MKKIILLSLMCLFSNHALAGMMTKFLPLNKVLVIMADNIAGQSNTDDAKNLFQGMNVPENHQDQGIGKSIVLDKKNLVLVCVLKKTGDYSCNINLAKNANSTINPRDKMFRYRLTGAQAEEVGKLFTAGADGIYRYESDNGFLKITSSREEFLIHYQE